MGMKKAINAQKLNEFINAKSVIEISILTDEIEECRSFLENQFITNCPLIDGVKEVFKNHPFLNEFIKKDIIINRIKISKGAQTYLHFCDELFPELREIGEKFAKRIIDLPKGIEKAEAWLYPLAFMADATERIEALIYFTSRGKQLLENDVIKKRWLSKICHDICDNEYKINFSKEIINKAKTETLGIEEFNRAVYNYIYVPNFFKVPNYISDLANNPLILGCNNTIFFRCIDWFEISGFDIFIDSLVKDYQRVIDQEQEPYILAWYLFVLCRSNVATKKIPEFVFETCINRLSRDNRFISTVSTLVFAWNITQPKNIKESIYDSAVELIVQSQLFNGAWPTENGSEKGDIIATCFAMHALSLAKPKNWENITHRASDWLISQQQKEGFWRVNNELLIWINVLCLDSIHLGQGDFKITTKFNYTSERKIIMIDYSKENWYQMALPQTRIVSYNEAKGKFNPRIAIIVAVREELNAVLKSIRPFNYCKRVWKVMYSHDTYYLGRFGAFDTVVQLCGTGSQGISGSTLAINQLIECWNPDCVVLTGIAFGVNKEKQSIADVLIADCIIPYEKQRKGFRTVFRSPIPNGSSELINRARNIQDWIFLKPDKKQANVHFGQILSGEKLIDNTEFKNSLLCSFPEAIGGEQEGTGLWSAAERNKKPWILIKAINDWGENKSDGNKELAAAAAVSFCECMFSNKHTLDGVK